MKTKIVYCLVSDNDDYFYERLLISLHSLRKHNPNAVVEVVCDNITFATLKDKRSGVFDYDIHVNSVETLGEWGKKERSRYIKTNLRKLVKGDYLFIDSDTVICSSLDCVDDISFDVAAVYDSHVERSLPKLSQVRHDSERWVWKEAQKAGVDVEGLWHFNSGVMYVKDTEKAHELYDGWHDNYKKLLAHEVKIDQLSLLLTNHQMNNIISPLDAAMNCQVSFGDGRKKVSDAKIIHYFPGQQKTILSSSWIMDPIKESGKININIQHIIDEPEKFFDKMSKIVTADADYFVSIPYLLDVSVNCPFVFKVFLYLLCKYVRTKENLKRWFGK